MSTPASEPRYSVVVPVFNESANIATFCARALRELPAGAEFLICYDFDEDDTLPALASMPENEKPAGLRLVRNDLGRGVRYAIEAGMRAARLPMHDPTNSFKAYRTAFLRRTVF